MTGIQVDVSGRRYIQSDYVRGFRTKTQELIWFVVDIVEDCRRMEGIKVSLPKVVQLFYISNVKKTHVPSVMNKFFFERGRLRPTCTTSPFPSRLTNRNNMCFLLLLVLFVEVLSLKWD